MIGVSGCRFHGGTAALDCAACEPTRRQDALAQGVAQVWPWDLCATLTLDPRKAPVVAPGPQRRPGRGRLQWPTRLTDGDSPRMLKAPVKTGTLAGRIRYWLQASQKALGRELVAL